MKLRKEFEPIQSSILHHKPVPSLDNCLGELLREEQHLQTQAIIEQKGPTNSSMDVAYVNQTKARDKSKIQCYSCKEYGHIANQCKKKLCNYCKKPGHIISKCRRRPQNKNTAAYHVTSEGSSTGSSC